MGKLELALAQEGLQDMQVEVNAALKMAESMDVNQATLLLIEAMGKKITTDGATEVKGFILSKSQIKQVKQYVQYGLTLPKTEAEVKIYLPYTDDTNPLLTTAYYLSVYLIIRKHCEGWSDLEASIKTIGTNLNIFGRDFVIIGDNLAAIINAMPVFQKIKQKVGTYKLEAEDMEYKESLSDLLADLRTKVEKHGAVTKDLVAKISAYREEMDNKVYPESLKLAGAIEQCDLTKNADQLLKEKKEYEDEAKRQGEIYKKMVGYAFTGAAGMVLPPLGVISWAITGGIFGDKAEKARKARDQAQKNAEEKGKEIAKNNVAIININSMKNKATNMKQTIADAVVGLQNLDTLWKNLAIYISNSQDELKDISDSDTLLVFSTKMASATDSWRQVKDNTAELLKIFEEAQRELNV
jgi:hypothetical protein